MIPLSQHQVEIERNLAAWENKPLLQTIYRRFYQRILGLIDPRIGGLTVEIGSGIGNLKTYLPDAICTDLFPNPWLDVVCDGYELPFADQALGHLVLFDVFHHLARPAAFLKEAARVLVPGGRLILFEPYISRSSHGVYGLLHHEPVGWRTPIDQKEEPPQRRDYYAAQGNATRMFFGDRSWLSPAWQPFHDEAFSAFAYLLSGGYSRAACYPPKVLPWLEKLDHALSRWPKWFGARCLIGLERSARQDTVPAPAIVTGVQSRYAQTQLVTSQ